MTAKAAEDSGCAQFTLMDRGRVGLGVAQTDDPAAWVEDFAGRVVPELSQLS